MTDTTTTEDLQAEIKRLKEQLQYAQENLGAFFFLMECQSCDAEIFEGLNITFNRHRGHPVIPFDMASQTNFQCSHCGADNFTGDFCEQVFTEGGSDSDDEDDTEEG